MSILTLAILPLSTGAQDTPVEPQDSLIDTTSTVRSDSVTADDIYQQYLEQMKEELGDTTADTTTPARPWVIVPSPWDTVPTTRHHSFSEMIALPHLAFSDHLVFNSMIDAYALTEFATSRRLFRRGFQGVPPSMTLGNGPLSLRRPTFPQVMAADAMMIPPFMFTSFVGGPSGVGDPRGNVIAANTIDSVPSVAYSDFLVRQGTHGINLTQGRLLRPLPEGRLVNLGFSFAQSDGVGINDAGNNRYLYSALYSPLPFGLRASGSFYQYRSLSDIQTASDFWLYRFTRDDLSWRTVLNIEPDDTVSTRWNVRLSHNAEKFHLKSSPSQLHSYVTKVSHTSLDAMYVIDTAHQRLWSVSAGGELQRFAIHSIEPSRLSYRLTSRYYQAMTPGISAIVRTQVTGTTDDAPAPGISATLRMELSTATEISLSAIRERRIPALVDRDWPLMTATFLNDDDETLTYMERGSSGLSSWWSNQLRLAGTYQLSDAFHLSGSTWAGYEEAYYYWRDANALDTALAYQPVAQDARTVGFELQSAVHWPTWLTTRIMYGYKRAETLSGRRLPDYIDHQLVAQSQLTIHIPQLNLQLHGAAEFMAWRMPSKDYTFYNRREVYRTDLIGSATIRGLTLYWLSQNFFNYGYRKSPGFNYVGQTVMWGLHLRLWN